MDYCRRQTEIFIDDFTWYYRLIRQANLAIVGNRPISIGFQVTVHTSTISSSGHVSVI